MSIIQKTFEFLSFWWPHRACYVWKIEKWITVVILGKTATAMYKVKIENANIFEHIITTMYKNDLVITIYCCSTS